jgi:hypothetical protein
MSAKVDVSESSVIAWCDECAWWAESARDIAHAHCLAVAHENAEHPACRNAAANATKWRKKNVLHV